MLSSSGLPLQLGPIVSGDMTGPAPMHRLSKQGEGIQNGIILKHQLKENLSTPCYLGTFLTRASRIYDSFSASVLRRRTAIEEVKSAHYEYVRSVRSLLRYIIVPCLLAAFSLALLPGRAELAFSALLPVLLRCVNKKQQ